jgi:putative membrane protein
MNQKLGGTICGAAAVSAALIFSMLVGASACSDDDDDAVQSGDAGLVPNGDGGLVQIDVGAADSAPTPDAMAVDDGQIAGAMVTVNEGEIAQGMLAATKAQTMAVRDFANMMVMHHRAALERAAAVATGAGIAPVPSVIKQMLQNKNAAKLTELSLVNPPAFDVLYIEGQIMAHLEVLNLLDTTFLPQAKKRVVAD